MGFPGGSDSKESACSGGDLGSTPGLGRAPGGGHGNPLQYSCLENLYVQRSLVSYSPRDCKELDTTKHIDSHSDAGRDWGQEEKGTTKDEMAGWHH